MPSINGRTLIGPVLDLGGKLGNIPRDEGCVIEPERACVAHDDKGGQSE